MSEFPGQVSAQKSSESELHSWELSPGLPWSAEADRVLDLVLIRI